MKEFLRVTGDIHGEIDKYINHTMESCFSIQVGDFSTRKFDYQRFLIATDTSKHKFFGGNHDNYDVYHESTNSLGNFGARELGNILFYFIRGAFSIDYSHRVLDEYQTGRKSWWQKEELDLQEANAALKDYVESVPTFMLTHTCPTDVARIIGGSYVLKSFGYDPEKFTTRTQCLLQSCFEAHKPKIWVFGHFHNNKAFEHEGTLFICLNDKMNSLDIDCDGNFSDHCGYSGNVITGEFVKTS